MLKNHKERAHSAIGASSAYRWWNCPGSVRLCDGIEDKASEYAEEGTRAHEFAEYCLTTGVKDASGPDAREHVHWTPEIAEAVQEYLDLIWPKVGKGSELEVERRFHLTDIDEDAYGTNDAMIYHPKKRLLEIFDYKHGAGVSVDAEDNKQLLYYALGAALAKDNLPIEQITMWIVQPRCNHPDGPVRSWTISAEDLMDWAGDLKQAVARTKEPDAPLVAGAQCRWCPAAPICPANQEFAIQGAKLDFTDPAELPENELSDLLDRISHIEAWIRSVREYAYARAMAGDPPRGYKLVQKRPSRKWADEKGAIKYIRRLGLLEEDYYEKKLKSVAQIEKQLDRDDREPLADFVVKESSGLTLAPDTDRRPAVTPNATDDFVETD